VLAPTMLQYLSTRSSEELRELMAVCAGLHSHRDGDNGEKVADALHRIADRLTAKPRRAA